VKDLACDHRGIDAETSDPAPSANQEDSHSRSFKWNWITENDKFWQSYEPISNPILPNDTAWLSAFANDPEWAVDIQWSSFEVGNLSEWAPGPTVSDIEEVRDSTNPVSDPNEAYVTTGDIYYERVRFASLQ